MVQKLEYALLLVQFLVRLGSVLRMGLCFINHFISFLKTAHLYPLSSPFRYLTSTLHCFYANWCRYIISSAEGRLTLYYEPHCVYNEELLTGERADIVITPVIKQLLPNFTLVSGQEDAVKLAKLLRARYVTVPFDVNKGSLSFNRMHKY